MKEKARTFQESGLPVGGRLTSKRPNKKSSNWQPEKDYSLARHLVSNFDFLEKDLQMQILEVVDATIEKDPHLMALALKQQSTLHAQRARELFDSRKLGPLEDLLRSLAPAAAIMVNIEVSLTSASYTEESATLARTLLPYIDKVADYRFLGEECHFICSRFLASLAVHLRDTQTPLSCGFIHFALHLNPKILRNMITTSSSIASLR